MTQAIFLYRYLCVGETEHKLIVNIQPITICPSSGNAVDSIARLDHTVLSGNEITTKTNYTITLSDSYVFAKTEDGGITLTLPDTASSRNQVFYIQIDSGANGVTVKDQGGQTKFELTPTHPSEFVFITSTGLDWVVTTQFSPTWPRPASEIAAEEKEEEEALESTGTTVSRTIDSTSIGETIYYCKNLGSGEGVFRNKSAINEFLFKSLKAGSGISLNSSSEDITITNTSESSISLQNGLSDSNFGAAGPPQLALRDSNGQYPHFVHTRHTDPHSAIDFFVNKNVATPSFPDDFHHTLTLQGSNVGVRNSNPTAALSVNGDIECRNISMSSDARLKTDIRMVTDDKLAGIHPVEFRLTSDDSGRRYYGFIAQEVERRLPELVQEDSNGFKKLDYIAIIPLLLARIEKMEERLLQLELQ